MTRSVFDHELNNLQTSSILGSLCFGLACLTLGTFINFIIALQTSSEASMSIQARSDYKAVAIGCAFLTVFFGGFAIYEHIKVWWQVRAIKQTSESLFVWSDTDRTWVKVQEKPKGQLLDDKMKLD